MAHATNDDEHEEEEKKEPTSEQSKRSDEVEESKATPVEVAHEPHQILQLKDLCYECDQVAEEVDFSTRPPMRAAELYESNKKSAI